MITIKSSQEIELMRKAGVLWRKLMNFKAANTSRITTQELDQIAEEYIKAKVLSHPLKAIMDLS